MTTPSIVPEKKPLHVKSFSQLPERMTVAEAIDWARRREASRLQNIEMELEGLQRQGIHAAYAVGAVELLTLERNGLMLDFATGLVEKQL